MQERRAFKGNVPCAVWRRSGGDVSNQKELPFLLFFAWEAKLPWLPGESCDTHWFACEETRLESWDMRWLACEETRRLGTLASITLSRIVVNGTSVMLSDPTFS